MKKGVVKSVGRGVFLGCFAGIRVVDPDNSMWLLRYVFGDVISTKWKD
jgi:hypothetical protein